MSAELNELLHEMVRLHDERGCVLTVHMERMKELLVEAPEQRIDEAIRGITA